MTFRKSKFLWGGAAVLFFLGAPLMTQYLLPLRIRAVIAHGVGPLLPRRGHPMPRTWPMLAGVKPHFLTSITNGRRDLWPCFSPDGMWVLFSRMADGHIGELIRVPVSGGPTEKLMRSVTLISATRASWSPNNNLIAFTGISTPGVAAIWVVNGDGTGARVLDASGLSDQMFYPSWYPDGSRLAAMDGRNLVIKRFDLAGGGVVTITDHAKVLTGKPSVSPDGKLIAFAGQRNAGQPYDQEQNVIWLVGEGGVLSTLEAIPVQGRSPAWSPDGTRLAFESDRGNDEGRYAVFVIGQDGRGLMQVTDYNLNATHPAWSPDGRHMVFDAKDPKNENVFGIATIDIPVVR
jgi:Tol biopolymer transport system component